MNRDEYTIKDGHLDVGQLIEAIHLQIYVYNTYRIHLALRMAPRQYLAHTENTRQVELVAN